jgi:hypothetical protein
LNTNIFNLEEQLSLLDMAYRYIHQFFVDANLSEQRGQITKEVG